MGRGSNPTWKRLSEAEWKAKREKGLCFRCDEKYTVGHRCKNRELQVMMIYDDEVVEAELEEEVSGGREVEDSTGSAGSWRREEEGGGAMKGIWWSY